MHRGALLRWGAGHQSSRRGGGESSLCVWAGWQGARSQWRVSSVHTAWLNGRLKRCQRLVRVRRRMAASLRRQAQGIGASMSGGVCRPGRLRHAKRNDRRCWRHTFSHAMWKCQRSALSCNAAQMQDLGAAHISPLQPDSSAAREQLISICCVRWPECGHQ